jgi:hypothetical protein
LLLVNQVFAARILFIWSANPTYDLVTNYIISYGTESLTYTYEVDTGNATNIILDGFYDDTTWYFSIQAENSNGKSPYSEEISLDIPNLPDMPENLVLILQLDSSTNLTGPYTTIVAWPNIQIEDTKSPLYFRSKLFIEKR